MKKLVAIGLAAAVVGFGLVAILITVLTGGESSVSTPTATACTPAPATVSVSASGLTALQLQRAAQIITVARSTKAAGTVGAIVAVATALAESELHNYANPTVPASEKVPNDGNPPHPNLDSTGLFQQRSSQGWGTVAETMTPSFATATFLSRLVKVPGWSKATVASSAAILGAFAQAVQISAFPDAYQAKIALATTLVTSAAPVTTVAATTTCVGSAGSVALPAVGLPAAVLAGIAQAPLQVQEAIRYALEQIGKPYLWGGTGPVAYDCSGLVMEAYAAAGVSIPRTSEEQATVGTAETLAEVEPGDLVFPYADESHVVMALGDGWMVEAPHTGAVVEVGPLYGSAGGIRRIVQPAITVVSVSGGAAGTGHPLSCPASSVLVAPGDVPAVVPDTAYCFSPGTYIGFSVTPQSGDGFYGGGAAVLQGAGQTSAFQAGTVSNLVIDGFTMQNYFSASNNQVPGVIELQSGANDLVSNNTIQNDRTSGISWGNDLGIPCCNIRNGGVNSSIITHNLIADIGYAGIPVSSGTGDTVSYNDVSGVNQDNADHEIDVAAIGKFAVDADLMVVGNYAHSNNSHGLWCDDYNENVTIKDNTIDTSNSSGIFYELSFAASIIGNHASGNGFGDVNAPGNPGSGIAVSSSGPVVASGNVLTGNFLPGIVAFVGHPGVGVSVSGQ